MELSRDRILTTHVGSLPRPEALRAMLVAREAGEAVDDEAFADQVSAAVERVVRRQVEIGIDAVSDGETAKISYATYVKDRYSGFGGEGRLKGAQDLREYRDYARYLVKIGGTIPSASGPCCIAEVALADPAALERDIELFTAAVARHEPLEGFLNAAAPGVVTISLDNRHYPSHDAYLEALAGVLAAEYREIVEAGLVLQIDCPDLAMGRHLAHGDLDLAGFRAVAQRHVEVLNAATMGLPADKLRLHLCWGNYEGPHHHDVPLAEIIDIVYGARPMALSIEAANPRHEHEWAVFKDHPLPDDKVLIPGVVDSTSNFIEHPELVAQRICRFAEVVGRERVIAGTDCGFATFAGYPNVFPDIVWAKLSSLVEGARRASETLW